MCILPERAWEQFYICSMRAVLFLIAGMLICFYWLSPVQKETPVLHDREHFTGQAKRIQSGAASLVSEKPAGNFPPEVVELFHEIIPHDVPEWTYCEPDSANTRIWPLTTWPDEEDVLLIQTDAGYAGGSCGWNIIVARYDSDSAKWNILLNDCGAVDSVYGISHNGLLDFSVRYRWSPTARYIFNGSLYVPVEEKITSSDSEYVAEILARECGYGSYRGFSFGMEYVTLDSSTAPYIIAWEGSFGKYLVHEESSGDFALIMFFEDAVQIDILSRESYGMPDIRTVCINMTNIYYRWNGRKYLEYKREEWHCPA